MSTANSEAPSQTQVPEYRGAGSAPPPKNRGLVRSESWPNAGDVQLHAVYARAGSDVERLAVGVAPSHVADDLGNFDGPEVLASR